jgi:hypothetical protein
MKPSRATSGYGCGDGYGPEAHGPQAGDPEYITAYLCEHCGEMLEDVGDAGCPCTLSGAKPEPKPRTSGAFRGSMREMVARKLRARKGPTP